MPEVVKTEGKKEETALTKRTYEAPLGDEVKELDRTQIDILYGLVTNEKDIDAAKAAGVGLSTLYKHKKLLLPMVNQFKAQMKERLEAQLQIASVIALNKLTEFLYDENVPRSEKLDIAREVFDRSMGAKAPKTAGEGGGEGGNQMVVQIVTKGAE